MDPIAFVLILVALIGGVLVGYLLGHRPAAALRAEWAPAGTALNVVDVTSSTKECVGCGIEHGREVRWRRGDGRLRSG